MTKRGFASSYGNAPIPWLMSPGAIKHRTLRAQKGTIMAKYTMEELYAAVSGLVKEVAIGARAESEDARVLPVKVADMSLNAVMYCLEYGIQRGVNDKCGGSDKDIKTKVEMAEDIILGWYDGVIRKRKAAVIVDSFTNIARKMVLARLEKAKRKELAEMPDKGAAWLDAVFKKNEEKLRPIVEAEIERQRKLAEEAETLDLDF